MTSEKTEGITANKENDTAEWYSQVCLKSNLAEHSPIQGFMVIKPKGYYIWECIQNNFNEKLRSLNVKNAYFPLLVPESFFKKEATHAKGFAPELAFIANQTEDKERLAIRPTSETVIYDSYSRWIRSWRDLPLRINQWCNVLRWEVKTTKLFLRSREFLWQEGHCVYETQQECDRETRLYLDEYANLIKDLLAVPVIKGIKTEKEKFPGADRTYTIEAFMPDGKGLQMGTSHNLSQGFGKAFNIKFIGKDEKLHVPFQNSWGISTRLIGAAVMLHSDNKGLVLPPKVAENKVVIIPILFEDSKKEVLKKCGELKAALKEFNPLLDDREDYSPGWKFSEHELNGIPIRIELGPKDLKESKAVIVSRDNNAKQSVAIKDLKKKLADELEAMHDRLCKKALKHLNDSIVEASTWKDFEKFAKAGKLIKAAFCNEISCEDSIRKSIEGITTRCIPLDDQTAKKGSKCIKCGKDAKVNIYFSRAY